MGEVRIVKLGPVHNGKEAVSFEDAFGNGVGGYSYASGTQEINRQRRKQRKLDRIENRREVQGARREARGERIADRTELQTARKSKRLTKREMGSESRLARKTNRADVRAYKKSLKNPQPTGLDQTVPQEMNDGTGAPATNPNIDPGLPIQTNQNTGNDQTSQDQGYNEGGLSPQTGQGNYYGDETQYQGPEYGSESDSEDVPNADPELDDAYEQGYQDAQEDFDNEEVSVDNFDGIMGAEDRYNEMQDKNDIAVNPAVQDLADKCIWNEKLIEALKVQRKNATANPQEISKTILVRAKRLKDLNNELVDYANCCGNYSNADGSPEVVTSRKKEVAMARKLAKMKAMRKKHHAHGGDITPVNAELNPVIENNRIVVPAESKSNVTGTGINGLDLVDDFDAPAIREVYLGADGSFTKGIDLGSIAVGVLLAIGFIALNKQYKWIKL